MAFGEDKVPVGWEQDAIFQELLTGVNDPRIVFR